MLSIAEHCQRIECALEAEDMDQLKAVCTDCDRFLRSILPLESEQGVDLHSLRTDLERVVDLYQKAVVCVEKEKHKAVEQLHALNRSSSSTNAYLNVARQFSY